MFRTHQAIPAFTVTEAEPPNSEGAQGLVFFGRGGGGSHSWLECRAHHLSKQEVKPVWVGKGRMALAQPAAEGPRSVSSTALGRKHAKGATWPGARPPALLRYLNATDEALGVEGDLHVLDRVQAHGLSPLGPRQWATCAGPAPHGGSIRPPHGVSCSGGSAHAASSSICVRHSRVLGAGS